MMFEDDEDSKNLVVKEQLQKHAARSTENDRARLLSDGEEYTDIFADGTQTGRFVDSSNLDEGESTSASDNEVMGYTGDAESYIDDDDDDYYEKTEKSFVPVVKEGTLINVNDDEFINESENHEASLLDSNVPKNVINNSIYEIASKLQETNLEQNKILNAKPGVPVKIDDNDDNKFLDTGGTYCSESDITTSAKESEGQILVAGKNYGDNNNILDELDMTPNQRKKRLKKRSKSYTENNDLTSSVEILPDLEKSPFKDTNGHSEEHRKHRRRSLTKKNQDKTRETKLIDIETPPQTPAISVDKTKTKETALIGSSRRIQSSRTKNKRRRSRYKIYLDDPDVHDLINDHVFLLQKYKEDLISGKKPEIKDGKHKNHQEKASKMPDVGFVGVNMKTNKLKPSTSRSVGPYDQHRGTKRKNIIARIRDESSSGSSSDEYAQSYIKGYQNVRQGSGRMREKDQLYEVCPDCGERHSLDEDDIVDSVSEVCPDCGVAHNPYEHRPSGQKPWQKYIDVVKASQRYEQVSTEQDPEDEREDTLPSIEGPHTLDELSGGTRYKLRYLGSSQILTHHPVTKETRLQQAQDAYNRIKGEEDDDEDACTNVDMVISLERIKILNMDTKFEDVMMDHALRTVCFVCDMGKILVLMARRLTSDHSTDFSIEQGKPISLGTIVGDKEKKTSKNICHVFECDYEASKIAKAIGQAFNIAYRQFLQSNGISHEHVEEAEYCHVLEAQKLVGVDLDRLTDQSASRDVVIAKKRGEWLGVMLLESGWGSMLPTVFIAHIANYSPAALCQMLSVGDHVLSCNGASLVGLPLSECTNILKNTRTSSRVVLKVVSCPPVVDVVVSRPDVKYQLGFSVQNGTICSLLRGGIAERGGIRVGHRIIEINGDSVVAKSHQHIVDILANTIGSISLKTMPVAMYRLMVGEDQPQHI